MVGEFVAAKVLYITLFYLWFPYMSSYIRALSPRDSVSQYSVDGRIQSTLHCSICDSRT